MDGVYNRSLFSKKATEARDKLRQMGGIAAQKPQMPPQMGGAGLMGMMKQPQMPQQPGGIMASSPELMQAMRKPVVLPASNQPAAPQMPPPMTAKLPPSQPIPNIAGIPQQGAQPPQQQQQPRPMAPAPARPQQPQQKQQPVKFAEGGDTTTKGRFGAPKDFKEAVAFGQKALTSEDPAKLGLPEGAATRIKALGQSGKSPEEVAKALTDTMPEKEKTGDTKKDLQKIAKKAGIEKIPVEAEIDELNTAIMGAQLGAAIAGSYVNPQTGQELRPTAGARIGQAVSQGLALRRDTETRRAEQEAELAKARIAAAARGTKPAKLTPAQEELVKLFGERAKTEDPSAVAEKFNQEFGPGVGDFALQFYRTGAGLGPSTTTTTEESPDSGVSVGTTATLKDGSIVEWTGSEWRPIK